MPIGNGGIIGPNNTPSLSSAKGVWSIQEAMLAQRAGTWPLLTTPDPYFDYTTLLLPGNGTNGAQNNTFLDSSTNNFTITRNGNTTQGTFSPFSQTGWGNYFDGTGDFLQVADAAPMELGSGNWTIEMWVNTLNNTQYSALFTRDDGGTTAGSYVILLNTTSANGIVSFYSADVNSFTAAVLSSGSVSCRDGAWHHIAVVRNSNTLTMYIDGTATSTASFSGSFGNTAQPLKIGSETGYARDYTGYISNVRLVVGTAVYTSNFTPPTTPLTAISGTSLLTCQSNRFIDNSTNAFAITRNGDVSVQAFSPFNPTAAWSTSTNGGSGYFDGSGDYLTVPDNAALQMGSGDFTVEYWWYPNNITSYQNPIDKGYTGTGALLLQTGNGDGRIIVYASGSAVVTSSTAVTANAWNHMALVRSGTTLTLYQNGASVGSATNSTNFNNTTQLGIGATGAPVVGSFPVVGYLSGVRFVKGTAVYSGSTYTVPTAPLTAITNTSLLTNFTNAGIYDATSKNDLETVGNAQISTTQSKFGGSSMYFDGTGDYLFAPSRAITSMAGDFTVEMWIYRNSGNNFFFTVGDSVGSSGFDLYIGNSGANLRLYSGNSVVIDNALTSVNFPTSTWTHVALVRFSGSVRMYVAGFQVGSAWSSTSTFSGNIHVGAEFYNGSITGTCNGYMQDVRVTNGIARYTSTFTPPTAAFPLL